MVYCGSAKPQSLRFSSQFQLLNLSNNKSLVLLFHIGPILSSKSTEHQPLLRLTDVPNHKFPATKSMVLPLHIDPASAPAPHRIGFNPSGSATSNSSKQRCQRHQRRLNSFPRQRGTHQYVTHKKEMI